MTSTEDRIAQVEQMRRLMGTAPNVQPELSTRFYRGVEGITVDLVPGSFPGNPYRAMFEMAVMTWGSTEARPGKWEDTPPRWRAEVIKGVLSYKALPLAMEAPKYTFVVDKISRWGFDQIARARLGVVFASMGTRDNCHLDIGFRGHESTWADPEKLNTWKRACLQAKNRYAEIVGKGQGSWQEARTVLPISCTHRFAMSINLMALRGLCGKRMKACEAEDVVAVAWLLRREIEKNTPYIASFLRPACDWAKRCDYHEAYSISEAFGALFRGCGRHPAPEYALGPEFQANGSCSDYDTLSRQTGYDIPGASERMPGHPLEDIRDRALFYEDWAGESDAEYPI